MRGNLIVTVILLLGLSLSSINVTRRAAANPLGGRATSYAPAQSGPTLFINDVSLVEGNAGTSNMVFTVTLTATGARPTIGVRYETANGLPPSGATAPSDYTTVSNFLIFPSGTGSTTMTISVSISGDTTVEPDETFFVNLGPADGATIIDGQGVGTIIDDDAPLPTLSINDVSSVEGNTGTSLLIFTVTLTATGSWSGISVGWGTSERVPPSATEGSDYEGTTGNILFFDQGTGNATRTLSVEIIGDNTVEPDETFLVDLNSSDATVTRQGVGTIINDDGIASLPTLSISDVSVMEGNTGTTSAILTVSLSAASGSAVTVDYATANGTARVSDNDYVSTSGSLTFPAGDTSPKTIVVTIIGDTRNEPDEIFIVNLGNQLNATIADGQGECRIRNDDGSVLPEISIYDGARVEGNPDPTAPNGGGGTVLIHLQLSNQSASDITVDYTVVDGTATVADNDYTNTSGTLTLDAGFFSQNIFIPIVADRRIEADEFLFVNLSNAVGATIRDGNAKCTILTDDCAYSLSATSQEIPFNGTLSGFIDQKREISVISEPNSQDCDWTLVSNDSWINVSSGTESGTHTARYSVDPNFGPARTGTITVAGLTFTINQEGICPASSYTVSPAIGTADESGGSGSITITAPGNCGWRASTNVDWIGFGIRADGSPASEGRGTGTLGYTVERFSGSNRWGAIIINGEIQHSVYQDNRKDCPVRLICSYFPVLCANTNTNSLVEARTFRDEVLARTPRGQRYTQLYYKFSIEAVGLMMLNPMLILRSRDMLERYRPVLDSMIKGEHVALTQGDIDEIESFLSSFAQKGSPELQETLKNLSNDLHDPQVHTEFNITITDGPKREVPEQGVVQNINRTGMVIVPLGLLLLCSYGARLRRKKQSRP